MTKTALQALVTKTAAFEGTGVDVSGIPAKQATIKVHIESLEADKVARIVLYDSVDSFTNKSPIYVVHVQGGFGDTNDKVVTIPWYNIPGARFGVTSADIRVDVEQISSAANLVYEAWVEY